ncbi:hypothetical protein ACUODF_49385, partial [Escherichia coli]
MVNLVIVSHSSRLGEGVGELARQMLMSDSCKIAIAAGIDDPQNPIGTDAVKVMEAIESVANGKIEMAWQETFWAHGFGKVT